MTSSKCVCVYSSSPKQTPRLVSEVSKKQGHRSCGMHSPAAQDLMDRRESAHDVLS